MIVDLVLNNTKAYINKEIKDCSIAIDNGKIFKISKEANMPKAEKRINLKGLLTLPGSIDAHVHLRDEGKAYKEDFYTGTAAAAAGGVTTVLDMPNNNPVTMSVETLKNRMITAKKRILVNVGFYSAFPNKTDEMKQIAEEGAVAFKLFMAAKIGGLDVNNDQNIKEAFRKARELRIPVAVHAEDMTMLEKAEREFKLANRNDVEAFLKAHSETVEVKAVKRLVEIVKQTRNQVHFCHISTEKGLKAIIDGKRNGLPITCEATPHHLFLSVDDLKKIGTMTLTVPPLREKSHVKNLWNGIKKRWIDIIASDHAPHTLDEKKTRNIWKVKVGIPGLETMLPLLLTEVNRGRLAISDVVRLTSEKPAEIFGLRGKGFIKEGNDGDLAVVDLHEKYTIDSSKFHSKAKFSPFNGWKVKGKIMKTFVSGKLIMDEGEIVAEAGSGTVIRRAMHP